MFRFLKKTFILFAGITALLGFSISCENPLNNNLGAKVTVERPIITVEYPERTGVFLKGTIPFSGKISAYRSIKHVEVMIHNNEPGKENEPLMNWTTRGIRFTGAGQKEGTWWYDLDTLKETLPNNNNRNGVNDGLLIIQFRVYDDTSFGDTIKLVYSVKNRGSDVQLTFPAISSQTSAPPNVVQGARIRGQVTDPKGLKPGYPQIKFWPEDLGSEPADDDPTSGYVSLFLTGYDEFEGTPSYGNPDQGSYNTLKDRYALTEPVRAAEFVFDLHEYDIVDENGVSAASSSSTQRLVKYRLDGSNNRIPLDTKRYRFRIKSSDTFYDGNGTPLLGTPAGEEDIVGYFPPQGWGDPNNEATTIPRGDPVTINIIKSEIPVSIRLDNSDIVAPGALTNKPYRYITESTSNKIPTNGFRLRVLITHPDGIVSHSLTYSHPSSGALGVSLPWTSTPAPNGVICTFELTASDPRFTSSTEPYAFEVRAESTTGINNNILPQRYYVYFDGDGPIVRLKDEIKGATKRPDNTISGLAYNPPPNDSPYTVKGNIQVFVDRYDNISGIMAHGPGMGPANPAEENNSPMVKWLVEGVTALGETTPALTGTVFASLNTYRLNPTNANLQFFYNITEDPSSEGWVKRDEQDGNNFKFNTLPHDGFEVWLYVMAMDGTHNLGWVIQKLKVDSSGDTPVPEILGLKDTLTIKEVSGTIVNDLLVTVGKDASGISYRNGGNWGVNGRENILEMGQGINLGFRDSDGIKVRQLVMDGGNVVQSGIMIRITDLNVSPEKTVTLNDTQLAAALPQGSSTDRRGMLTQQIMAQALGTGQTLPDGFYKVEFQVADDVETKVAISPPASPGDTPVSEATGVLTYFFGVYTEPPSLVITGPRENSIQTGGFGDIEGTIRSRFDIEKAYITYSPNILITPPELYKEIILPARTAPNDGDYYSYDWILEEINFNPWPHGDPLSPISDMRRFTVEVFDKIGNRIILERMVQVDTTPPTVSLVEFNNNRMERVHGKVAFVISGNDANGLRKFPYDPHDPEDIDNKATHSGVKWLVLHEDDPLINPLPADLNDLWGDFPYLNTPVSGGRLGGHFLKDEDNPPGSYRKVINTTSLVDGATYHLLAAAIDNAGLVTVNLVHTFVVDQDSDYPTFEDGPMSPINGTGLESFKRGDGLFISGLVKDDDLFDITKVNSYVKIGFPKSTAYNGTELSYTSNANNWNWYDVPGTLNSIGDISFNFKFEDYTTPGTNGKAGIYDPAFFNYFDTQGIKYYLIQVTDEPVAGDNNYGKNPDGESSDGSTYIDKVTRVFPRDTGGYEINDVNDMQYVESPKTRLYAYRFVLDDEPPIIKFNTADPNDPRYDRESPQYVGDRPIPSYTNSTELLDALNGMVIEGNLEYLSYTFGSLNGNLLEYQEGTEHDWDFNELSSTDKSRFVTQFNNMGDGSRTITLEARDKAGFITRVTWMFYKDTQGPKIDITSISRAIRHDNIPAVGNFPATWPDDWPYGSDWTTDGAWAALRDTYGVANWPLEYRHLSAADVVAKLTEEHNRTKTPSNLVITNTRNVDGDGNIVIKGTFQDSYSDVRINDTNSPPTMFEYRLNNGVRNDVGWIEKPIETPAVTVPGDPNYRDRKFAEWTILIPGRPEVPGYDDFTDGPNHIDLRIKDSVGNWSELFNLEFILDRADPYFFFDESPAVRHKNDPDYFELLASGWTGGPLQAETKRVIGASITSPVNATVFTLRGTVFEYNLLDFAVTIGQQGSSYNITAMYDHMLTLQVPPDVQPIDKINGVADPDNLRRLTVTPVMDGPDFTGVYEWELTVLDKDVVGLRTAAGANADRVRRHVRVTVRDLDKRQSGPHDWYFYLDTSTPSIEYTNVERGPNNFSVFSDFLEMRGIARDTTKIQDIQFRIGKWSYEDAKWYWYNTTSHEWDIQASDSGNPLYDYVFDSATWPSLLTDYPIEDAATTVNWALTEAIIDASGNYPNNLSAIEGQYRLDLRVTDWSLGSGNPLDTSIEADPAAGMAWTNARKFFIDHAPPQVAFTGDAFVKQYFSNDSNGQVVFDIVVRDPNTIASIAADVVAEDNITVVVPEFGFSPISPRTSSITPMVKIDDPGDDHYGWYKVTVKPTMTVGERYGNTSTDSLDQEGGNTSTRTFTLRLYVKDGAGREATSGTTKEFKLDNRPPTLENIHPEHMLTGSTTDYAAIAGKVTIRGNANDNSDSLNRVAFYVANSDNSFAAPADFTTGWYYGSEGATHILKIDTVELMEIDGGTFTWNIMIPNSSNFYTLTGSGDKDKYVQWTTAAAAPPIWFDGKLIRTDNPTHDVGKLTVYIMAEDDAGNRAVEELVYWIYPEGDRPIVTAIRNPNQDSIEVERMLNGTFRISGQAKDNEYVRDVWFRVLDGNITDTAGNPNPGYETPYTLDMPIWNEKDWSQPGSGKQTPQASADIGFPNSTDAVNHGNAIDGWYKANRGGDGRTTVSWWASINSMGELNRKGGNGPNRIIIEVRVQDMTTDRDDEPITALAGLLSWPQTVSAFVATGAPIFDSEKVYPGPSDPEPAFWGSISDTHIRRRASYRITVRDDNGIRAIRWTRTQGSSPATFAPNNSESYNLLDRSSTSYAATKYAVDLAAVNAGTLGMAAKAEPHPDWLKGPGDSISGSKEYLVWTWPTTPLTSAHEPGLFPHDPTHDIYDENGITVIGHADMRFTVFKPATTTAVPSGVELIERDEDGYFRWVVTVDVNTEGLGLGTEPSVLYPVYLSATDVSGPSALTASRVSYLPIDESPPHAVYTLNRRPAGLLVAIGGEAVDEGEVSGVGKVVLWFSRLNDSLPTRGRSFVSWRENDGGPGAVPFTADTSGWANELKTLGAIPATTWDGRGTPLLIPHIPGAAAGGIDPNNTNGTGGDSAIVIDRNNPSVGTNHHGHNLPMGFSAGGIGTRWYVEINSTNITSGPVTMHVVVFDKAGNGRYYEEPLVIMNNAPSIRTIKLGTDIRDIQALRTASTGFTANEKAETNDWQTTGTSDLLDRIRAGMNTFSTTQTDVSRGISDYINYNAMTVDNIIDFNVRNKLLALRVETNGKPNTGKNRHFRLEYVSGATLITDLTHVKAGRVYIIHEPGIDTTWGSLGAVGAGPWTRGYAFLAAVDGTYKDGSPTVVWNAGGSTPSAYELNSSYYAYPSGYTNPVDTYSSYVYPNPTVPGVLTLADAAYGTGSSDATSAEFAYHSGAFSSNDSYSDRTSQFGSRIIDFAGDDRWPTDAAANGEWTTASGTNWTPARDHSLFILKVIDGIEDDLFWDFALLRIRVNNNDMTAPYAQMHDLNPMTEGQGELRQWDLQRSATPMIVGEGPSGNRLRGGLYVVDGGQSPIEKSGHIEPRRITTYTASPYSGYQHSLSSMQMGGTRNTRPTTAADLNDPSETFANPLAFFAADTVSGKVILRGYAEDDQRIERIAVEFITTGTTGTEVTILEKGNYSTAAATWGFAEGYTIGSPADYQPPRTGFLKVPSAQVVGGVPQVYFTDSVDLYRHRVEWAYVWDSETLPANTVVGNITVRVNTYNARAGAGGNPAGMPSPAVRASDRLAHRSTDTNNPGFPVGLYRYNEIGINLRPYITGFVRNKTQFRHDTRSLQGRYILARAETPVIKGFNLGRTGVDPTITLPGTAALATAATISTANQSNYELASTNISRYRVMNAAIPAGAITGNGTVTLTAGAFPAANTGAERPRLNAAGNAPGDVRWIQPWNTESANTLETNLWDDFTSVHIWQSNDTTGAANAGYFPKTANWVVEDPSMSINPSTGELWAAWSENGNGGNYGRVYFRNNSGGAATLASSFIDPIIQPDIFFSPTNNTAFVASSIIGRSGTGTTWGSLGGIWVYGAGGANPTLSSISTATTQYLVESTWLNGSATTMGNASSNQWVTTDQFNNPHVVNATVGGTERIHVSYYDNKDGSIKYKYNTRGSPGTINSDQASHRTWVNLDGGFDAEDMNTSGNTSMTLQRTLIAANDGVSVPEGNRAIRTVHTTNGATVNPTNMIYTLGPADRTVAANPSNTTVITVPSIPGAVGSYTITLPTEFRSATRTPETANLVQGTAGNRYLRIVHVDNYSYVNQGDLIYTFGTNTAAGGGATTFTYIYASRGGYISLDYPKPTYPGMAANGTYTTQLANNARVYTISDSLEYSLQMANGGPVEMSGNQNVTLQAAYGSAIPATATTVTRTLTQANGGTVIPTGTTATSPNIQTVNGGTSLPTPADAVTTRTLTQANGNNNIPVGTDTSATFAALHGTLTASTGQITYSGNVAGLSAANNYLREVGPNVRVGATLKQGDLMFVFGPASETDTTGLVSIYAPRDLTIIQIMTTGATGYSAAANATVTANFTGTAPNRTFTVRRTIGTTAGTTTTSNRLYAVDLLAANFLRERKTGLANDQWVQQGELLYVFGAQSLTATVTDGRPRTTYEVYAPATGLISNVFTSAIGTVAPAGNIYTVRANAYNYIRQTHVVANQYVYTGDPIYTIGSPNESITTGTYTITAPASGNITVVTQGTSTGTAPNRIFTTAMANTATAFSIVTNSAQNYVRWVNPAIAANGNHVMQGDVVYLFGPRYEDHPGPFYELKATAEGTISNLLTADIGAGTVGYRLYTNQRGTQTGALPAGRAFTITPVPFNYLRQLHVANNQPVTAGDPIMTFGVTAKNRPHSTVYILTAPYDGIISGLPTFAESGTAYTTAVAAGTNVYTITTSPAYNYVREIHVTPGQFVTAGTLIYTYGQPPAGYQYPAPLDTTYPVTALYDGNVTNLLAVGAQTANNATAYTIATPSYNYLRRIGSNITEGGSVTKGQLIYIFGVQEMGRSLTTYEIRAPFSGVISGLAGVNATGVEVNGPNNGTNYTYTRNNTGANSALFTIMGDYPVIIPSDATLIYTLTYTGEGAYQRVVKVGVSATTGRYQITNPYDMPSGHYHLPDNHVDAGYHNAIAVTSQGYPVVAYYDNTNGVLKMAISNSAAPNTAAYWDTHVVIREPQFAQYRSGTGQYVSLKINHSAGPGYHQEQNRFHIAALNANSKKLVYISGILNPGGLDWSVDTVQMVDNVGDVGRWCVLSLDEDGNPWIAYHDEGYSGSRDGVKLAFLNRGAFTKTLTDRNGSDITGWETMHIPTNNSVENARLGMECFPARNNSPGTNTRFWKGAVGYMAPDFFRLAYYVE